VLAFLTGQLIMLIKGDPTMHSHSHFDTLTIQKDQIWYQNRQTYNLAKQNQNVNKLEMGNHSSHK
ncbi:hypothetical protein, partial [Escherichia coli]|uniref:hypothetical protein n=1 Tax=Escherichia coli TaxID=562 RepID=UPI001AD8FF5A